MGDSTRRDNTGYFPPQSHGSNIQARLSKPITTMNDCLNPASRHPVQPSRLWQGPLLLVALASLVGCAAPYEPAKAGTHRGPGDSSADILCSHETPTASRLMQTRCVRVADLKRQGEMARQEADTFRTAPPEIK